MSAIPRPALLLGLAGLLPFLFGAALSALGNPILPFPIGWLTGTLIMAAYGKVILSFMSGVLWGFAARGAEGEWWGYGLSVLPALYVFFFASGPPLAALPALAIGFPGLLALDLLFSRRGLTPAWWMALRTLLTVVVTACLVVGIVA